MPIDFPNVSSFFGEFREVISIEAENYQTASPKNGFAWRVITGLGKTGDSVSVFPNSARTFADIRRDSPALEYDIAVGGGEYTIEFFLIPTQPLVPGGGLRIAFAIDDGEPQIVVADKDTEVSSRKWSQNVLDQTTVAKHKFSMSESNSRRLRIFAVDTGVVLDKIVISSQPQGVSYFGPKETRFRRSQK